MVCMENKACANCRYGEYYSDKYDVWCSLYEKWVGLPGCACGDWKWIAADTKFNQEISR